MKQHLFVNIMIALQIGAIGQYSIQRNWVMVGYWGACLAINYIVTYRLN